MTNKNHLKGFASMTPERRREVARKGGYASHEAGTGHRFTRAEARAAGRKGGKTVSSDKAHMAAIGRKGWESRRAKKAAEKELKKAA